MNNLKNTITLLRIPFSIYLMPIYFFALSQTSLLNTSKAIWVFFLLHLLIYPASNGYNSYMDKDTESIGGLEKPPMSTKQLYWVTLGMDITGLCLALLFVNTVFTGLLFVYILMSRAYSSKLIRLKKFPILGFLTVFIFQGFWTFWMVFEGVKSGNLNFFSNFLPYAAVASSFMIGGAYPLSQIYQHKQDAESGDKSLSMLLGINGTFYFGTVMFTIAGILLYYYFEKTTFVHFYVFVVALFPLIIWFNLWMAKTLKNKSAANFKNLMRMNNTSALCMNGCYILLAVLNHTDLFQL
ncbi:UbiA family prenyltransferase [Flammeovirga kamogawensis]|uniref:UbiA family prenyltransferase n=1 Tax=Flammeovirga kamogawensis TaxID=373891 RepID=A0ABX8H3U4_9BACT|nr:UbiA family prenyltransferase [Flammeovirga kamogawensis]MBB6460185.1 1,4-dihydroxy-2-naphthoate octaprenyltransferase [Flammeovirga kamogawensis]QWG09997.1 UbiA family prenyltransferase [Flammeovirga kamogawensis]TRX65505.1 prenyltransferase [Flammeovirga kamogawensis]